MPEAEVCEESCAGVGGGDEGGGVVVGGLVLGEG